MFRLVVACALVAGCSGGELVANDLPACKSFRDGHWDSRLITPGASGASPKVVALQQMPDGSVIAGGWFDAMSGVAAKNVARWDGTRWSALGPGLPGQVKSLAVDDRGQLWAVGDDFNLGKPDDKLGGGLSGAYLALWTGAEWTMVVQQAYDIYGVTTVDGGIAVYGSFFQVAALPASGVAIWRDGMWSTTGLVNGGNYVLAAARSPDGVCVAGQIQPATGGIINGVACWNGAEWSRLGNAEQPFDGTAVAALARANDGRWYVGGNFRLFGPDGDRFGIARLATDGTWESVESGIFAGEGGGDLDPYVSSISVVDDGFVVAGRFEWVGMPMQPAFHLARWSASSGWSAMTPPTDLFGSLSAVLATGERTYVGGAFPRIGVAPGAGIASVEGGAVHALPAAPLAATRLGTISDMIALPEGMLLAGQFRDADIDATDTYGLLLFDGEWQPPILGVPFSSSMSAVALADGYAVRAGGQLFRRRGDGEPALVTDKPVAGPLVADGNGTMFFVIPTEPSSTIIQSTPDDTSFFSLIPGTVEAMAIYDGALVVVTSNPVLGGQTVYRRVDDDWQLIGAWADYTSNLVVSPALGLVAATQSGTRVWNGIEWRTISDAFVYDMAACSDGVVAAIDEGAGSRLAFLDDLDGDWTYFGEPRGAQWWQITPTERGVYIGTAFAGSSGVKADSPLGFARWTTLDDTGW